MFLHLFLKGTSGFTISGVLSKTIYLFIVSFDLQYMCMILIIKETYDFDLLYICLILYGTSQ